MIAALVCRLDLSALDVAESHEASVGDVDGANVARRHRMHSHHHFGLPRRRRVRRFKNEGDEPYSVQVDRAPPILIQGHTVEAVLSGDTPWHDGITLINTIADHLTSLLLSTLRGVGRQRPE